jgi:hypothetical protein
MKAKPTKRASKTVSTPQPANTGEWRKPWKDGDFNEGGSEHRRGGREQPIPGKKPAASRTSGKR